MRPERLWYFSYLLHTRKVPILPQLIKSILFVIFGAVLPYECKVPKDIILVHRGLGTVIHPKTVLGSNIRIGHHVTIAAGSQKSGDDCHVTVEDDVFIGTGAVVLPKMGASITIGMGAVVGANSLLNSSVARGGRAYSPRAVIS